MKNVIWIMVIALIVLHQDIWFWHDKRLVAGFLPVGLLYHMILSVAAAATWLLATKIAWPDDPDDESNDVTKGAAS